MHLFTSAGFSFAHTQTRTPPNLTPIWRMRAGLQQMQNIFIKLIMSTVSDGCKGRWMKERGEESTSPDEEKERVMVMSEV